MTRLLLDYPWPVEAGLGTDPAPYKAILDFLDLLGRTKLDPVPFIDHAEHNIFWNTFTERKGQGRFGPVLRFLWHCTKDANGISSARPVPEPVKLRDSWKRALRDQLTDLSDWRNPHIVCPESRVREWEPHGNEVALRCEECDDLVASGLHKRVLAVLERYESHPFAISDLDPWDVRCTAPDGKHPCYLPNPLIPDVDPLQNPSRRVPITQLYEELAKAHSRGWIASGKYFFIPPADWRPEIIPQAAWREGRAFPRKLSPERHQMGYSDFAGRVWVWHKGRGKHKGEDHWDIQLGGTDYISINHTGDPV